MNIVGKLTHSHLKQNKGRTAITTLGICVSVAMITAVFVAVASFLNLFGELTIYSGGDYHALIFDLSGEQLEKLEADERIADVGCYIDLPAESGAYKLTDRASESLGTGNFYAGDEINLKQKITCELEGSIPQNENEIAVEQSVIDKNNLDWKIGDTVEIIVGSRIFFDEETGESTVIEQGSYNAGEEFEAAELHKFKITGILHENNPTYYGTKKIIRGLSTAEKEGAVNASVTLKNANYKSLVELDDIFYKINADSVYVNKDYLETRFAIDEDSVLATSLIPMGLVILAIIIIASVVLIYNAFGMSISERTRYLGMLGSVGATKKQKKQSVYYEGFILGAVGIPLGIIGGIVGISVTLKVVGSRIVSSGMLLGVENSGIEMKTVVPIWAIAGIVVFSVLTIFISAFVPAKKASEITPVEALRQVKDFKVKAKGLKTPKYIRKIFGYEGELAHKNLKRNGRKSKVIVASIAMSMVLFLSVNYFCQMFMQANDMEADLPYQLLVNAEYEHKDEIVSELNSIDGIDKLYSATCSTSVYFADEEGSFLKKDMFTSAYKSLAKGRLGFIVNAVEDEVFNDLCAANGIDYNEYYNGTLNALLLNNIQHKSGGSDVFNDNILGCKMDNDVIIKDFIEFDKNNYVFSLSPKGYVSLYVPESVYFANQQAEYISLGIETSSHEKTCEEIEAMFEASSFGYASVMDYSAALESVNTIIFVLQVFVYGFIALITLITLANIINTISTSIDLRRKEFAMLKSVGTTQKGFYKMICLESIFYGLRAIVPAIPISILASYGMNKALGSNSIPFEINYLMYAAVILAVFVIIGISMLCSVSKLKNDSIIETLKEDIS